MNAETLTDYHPVALADIIWGIFSGIVLREKIKRVVNVDDNFFQRKFELAFDIFIRGLRSPK
jgi:hypothetical protein